MPRTPKNRATSLKELGYTITQATGKDEKGNAWIWKVKGTAPEFYIKQTKKGRLEAFKTKDAKVASTIEGLYNFEEADGDLVGQRYTPGESKPKESTATSKPKGPVAA
jgi:hypothetical protein